MLIQKPDPDNRRNKPAREEDRDIAFEHCRELSTVALAKDLGGDDTVTTRALPGAVVITVRTDKPPEENDCHQAIRNINQGGQPPHLVHNEKSQPEEKSGREVVYGYEPKRNHPLACGGNPAVKNLRRVFILPGGRSLI